jgi:hypothetical protein
MFERGAKPPFESSAMSDEIAEYRVTDQGIVFP